MSNSRLVEDGVEELVELLGLHTLEHCGLVNGALAEQVHCYLDHSGTSALSVTSLKQPQFAILDSEFHVLHVVVVLLESLLYLN